MSLLAQFPEGRSTEEYADLLVSAFNQEQSSWNHISLVKAYAHETAPLYSLQGVLFTVSELEAINIHLFQKLADSVASKIFYEKTVKNLSSNDKWNIAASATLRKIQTLEQIQNFLSQAPLLLQKKVIHDPELVEEIQEELKEIKDISSIEQLKNLTTVELTSDDLEKLNRKIVEHFVDEEEAIDKDGSDRYFSSMIESLLDRDQWIFQGWSLLHLLSKIKDPYLVEDLFEQIIDNFPQVDWSFELLKKNDENQSPWEMALENKNTQFIQSMLNEGLNTSEEDIDGNNLVYYAIFSEYYTLAIKILLDEGEKKDQEWTPLHILGLITDPSVIQEQLDEIISFFPPRHLSEALLKKNADGISPWQVALENNNIAFIQEMQRRGVKLQAIDTNGRSLLNYAMSFETSWETLEYLLSFIPLKATDTDEKGNNCILSICDNPNLFLDDKRKAVLYFSSRPELRELLKEKNYFGQGLNIDLESDSFLTADKLSKTNLSLTPSFPIISQDRILKIFSRFVSIEEKRGIIQTQQAKEMRQILEKGHCNGFAFLAPYYFARGKKDEYFKILKYISTLPISKKSSRNEEILTDKEFVTQLSGEYSDLRDLLNQWLNDLIFFQSVHHILTMPQLYAHKQRQLQYQLIQKDQAHQIEILFPFPTLQEMNKAQLVEFLTLIQKAPTFQTNYPLILEFEGALHATSGYSDNSEQLNFYDPNAPHEMLPFTSIESFVDALVKNHFLDAEEPLEVRILAYAFVPSEQTIKISSVKPSLNLENDSPNQFSAFHFAIFNHDVAEVKRLLAEGETNPNTLDAHEKTPLEWAIALKSNEIVKILLMDTRIEFSENLFDSTIESNNLEALELLLNKDFIPREKLAMLDLLLIHIIEQDLADFADLLLLQSIYKLDVNNPRYINQQQLPLEKAVERKSLEMMKVLLKAGANPFLTADANYSPAKRIADSQDRQLLKAFVDSITDVNVRNPLNNNTLAHLAIHHGNLLLYRLLKQKGANLRLENNQEVNVKNYKHQLMISLGARLYSGHGLFQTLKDRTVSISDVLLSAKSLRFISFLIDNCSNIEEQDEMGNSLLHLALKRKNLGLVRELKNRGADFQLKNRAGISPQELMDALSENERLKIAE